MVLHQKHVKHHKSCSFHNQKNFEDIGHNCQYIANKEKRNRTIPIVESSEIRRKLNERNVCRRKKERKCKETH